MCFYHSVSECSEASVDELSRLSCISLPLPPLICRCYLAQLLYFFTPGLSLRNPSLLSLSSFLSTDFIDFYCYLIWAYLFFIFSFSITFSVFSALCARLHWLTVDFWARVNIYYHIVWYRCIVGIIVVISNSSINLSSSSIWQAERLAAGGQPVFITHTVINCSMYYMWLKHSCLS